MVVKNSASLVSPTPAISKNPISAIDSPVFPLAAPLTLNFNGQLEEGAYSWPYSPYQNNDW